MCTVVDSLYEFKRSHKTREHARTTGESQTHPLPVTTQHSRNTNMPSQTQFTVPLTGVPRPPLPLEHLNPHIKTCSYSLSRPARFSPHRPPVDSANIPTVKFQEIIREGQSTIVRPIIFLLTNPFLTSFTQPLQVARMKVPTVRLVDLSSASHLPHCFHSPQVTRSSFAVSIRARSVLQPCFVPRSPPLATNRRG